MRQSATDQKSHSRDLKQSELLALRAGFAVLLAIVAVTAANALFGLGGTGLRLLVREWLSCVVYAVVAAIVALRAARGDTHRRSWALFAIGLALYALGNLLWSVWLGRETNPPIPSISDGLWLALYPLSYAGIVGFARLRNQRRLPAGVWFDGVIAGSGFAALGAALVFGPVLAAAKGNPWAVATELAYPVADLLLAALVVGVLALRGFRLDRAWGLLGGGFLLLAVADCMYAAQVANGASQPSAVTDLFYLLAVTLMAFAAWQREPRQPPAQFEGWSVLTVPTGFTLVALGLLLYDHFHKLDELSFALATVTLAAATARIGLAFRDMRTLGATRHLAATDDLTSLPNRRFFMQCAGDAIAAYQPDGVGISVLMLDLDNFKELNDTLGHSAGDSLLRQIGPRLQAVLRTTDTLARLGGDEFAILLDPQPDAAGVARVAGHVLDALGVPFAVRGLALRITASVGIASFPEHARDLDDLLKCADIAMYQAKAARSGYAFYAREQDTNTREHLGLAAVVAEALENDRIEVHFQPVADAVSRQIVGSEALVRMRHADGTLVAPLTFLAAAEQGGLSRALTRRVLSIALDQLAEWREAGHCVTVAVNTTVADLLDVDFPHEVAAALAARTIPPEALVLEVTETAIMADPVRIGSVLAQLGKFGILLSLDDFGTGYSSLTHLKELPVGEVKIDRSFISHVCVDATDAAIVEGTILLARTLGIRTVAEGVEDDETWAALLHLGCNRVQGYGLGRPVPGAGLEPLLQERAVRFDGDFAPHAPTVVNRPSPRVLIK